jgi:hypothetical protein
MAQAFAHIVLRIMPDGLVLVAARHLFQQFGREGILEGYG